MYIYSACNINIMYIYINININISTLYIVNKQHFSKKQIKQAFSNSK